ncbi:MAG: lysophospholipid acyltransferase family protein [Paracoccaceae bacterium]|nr:lysophospholipid acyltransferase family protein [Paracoccaceae bacterium]MDG2258678.1 lysophospholipid acyltransferase family protein [Paracoccaceae bacterium]
MNEKSTTTPVDRDGPIYDRRSLTYSTTFTNPVKRTIIKSIEMVTGKLPIIRRIREFERVEQPKGQAFWAATMKTMGIDLLTPQDQIDNIPAEGPVVLVANHPHGLVDGMILAEIIGRRRDDYRILTRSMLTGIDESASKYMIAVPFPHEEDAQKKMLEMRNAARKHLLAGGLVAIFPSGSVAASESMFGPAIEAEWNVFTSKLIKTTKASVVPMYFPGSNSRYYHIANRISATLRQSLLLHEVVYAFDKPQKPVIGPPVSPEEGQERSKNPRAFMEWLRERTLALKETD